MHSTRSTILFVLALTSIVAILLAGLFIGLKPIHDINEAIYNKRAVLSAVQNQLGQDLDKIEDPEIEVIFSKIKQVVVDLEGKIIEESVVNDRYKGGKAEHIDMAKEKKLDDAEKMLPMFEFTSNEGKKFYIATVRGNGLWDEIWGYIALEDDLNTIAGVAFDHKAETPGLGAEIKDNGAWKQQFIGKKLYDKNGDYQSIYVRKGGAKDQLHDVDGISGATITGDGVSEMIERGLEYYAPYFKTVKG